MVKRETNPNAYRRLLPLVFLLPLRTRVPTPSEMITNTTIPNVYQPIDIVEDEDDDLPTTSVSVTP